MFNIKKFIALSTISIMLISSSLIQPSILSSNKPVNTNAYILAKPGVNILLVGTTTHSIEPNEQKDITLELQTQLSSGLLSISIIADKGIHLPSAPIIKEFDLTQSPNIMLPITVLAEKRGKHYLNIFIEHIDTNGQKTSRALASEIRVGESSQRIAKNITFSSTQQQTIISLPSKETIF